MSNVAQNEASAEPERPAEGMSDAQLAEVAALRARVADLETARDRAEAKATAYKAERDLAVDWSARKQDAPSGLRVAAPARSGIYMASKAKHGPRWQALRASGVPIISTWIDESGEGETSDWAALWDRCIEEATTCAAMIVYVEPGEVHKGSLVEVGAALHAGVPVFWVGPEYSTAPRHRNVRRVATLDEAIVIAQSVEGDPTPEGRGVADDGPPEPIVADVLPGEYEAAGAAVAMMRDPKVVAVVTEVLALAPALADISGGPGTVDEAWQDIGREMQEPCGRNGLLTIAMLAIHGALAYDAAGLPTAGSSIARRVAELAAAKGNMR